MGLVWTWKFPTFNLHWQQTFARLFQSLSCPGSCKNQRCFLERSVTPLHSSGGFRGLAGLLSHPDETHFGGRKPHTFLSIRVLSAHHLVAVNQRDAGPTCHHLPAFFLWLSVFHRVPPELSLGQLWISIRRCGKPFQSSLALANTHSCHSYRRRALLSFNSEKKPNAVTN